MADPIDKKKTDEALATAAGHKEYVIGGRRMMRQDVDQLQALRTELRDEERVARKGDVLERASFAAPRRG